MNGNACLGVSEIKMVWKKKKKKKCTLGLGRNGATQYSWRILRIIRFGPLSDNS